MKVFAGTIAYNAEFTIAASLRSLYDYVDRIYVIDGSAIGPSTDRTAQAARSVGGKVEVVSGTFKCGHTHDNREWGEQEQRQAYINLMEKDENNWCILHDADEVWDEQNIERLVSHARIARPNIMLLSYHWTHFFRDPWHTIIGGNWSRPRAVGTFRLVPGVAQTSYNTVGMPKQDWTWALQPTKVILDDVMFYHYGHVHSFERYAFKVKAFVEQGLYGGYEPHEWERYRRESLIPWWNKGVNIPSVVEYNGEHPKAIQHLIPEMEKFYEEQEE